MIPLLADLVELLAEWTATNSEHIRTSGRLVADGHAPIDRRTVHRIVARIGSIAGIDDMHPHRLRHTLATQAINRGMRLEAIAALLGHRSLEMTLVYAKITDRVVADEYAAVCEQIDALYTTAATPGTLPAEIETNAMARLRQETHARMLGNGMCTRPVELDCRMETICETCACFDTGTRIRPRPPPPTRPRPRTPTTRPSTPLRQPHPTSGNSPLTAITRITPGSGAYSRHPSAATQPALEPANVSTDQGCVGVVAPLGDSPATPASGQSVSWISMNCSASASHSAQMKISPS